MTSRTLAKRLIALAKRPKTLANVMLAKSPQFLSVRAKIKSPSTSCLGKVQGFFAMSLNNASENVSDRC